VTKLGTRAPPPATILTYPVSRGSLELHVVDGSKFTPGDRVMLGDQKLVVGDISVHPFMNGKVPDTIITVRDPVETNLPEGTILRVFQKFVKKVFGSTTLNYDVSAGSSDLYVVDAKSFDEGDTIQIGDEEVVVNLVSWHAAKPGKRPQAVLMLKYPIKHDQRRGTEIAIVGKVFFAAETTLTQHAPAGRVTLELADGQGFMKGDTIVIGDIPYVIKEMRSHGKASVITLNHPIQLPLDVGAVIRVSKKGSRMVYASTTLQHDAVPGSMELSLADGKGFSEGDTLMIGDHVFFIKTIAWPGAGPQITITLDHAVNFHAQVGTPVRVTRHAGNLPTAECFASDMKFSGSVLADVSGRASSVFDCQSHCLHSPDCAHFTYWPHGDYCTLHAADAVVAGGKSARGYVSGPPMCSTTGDVRDCWSPRDECVKGPWTSEGHTYEGCAYGRTPSGWCSLVKVQPGAWLPCDDTCDTSAGSAGTSIADSSEGSSSAGSSSIPSGLFIFLCVCLLVIVVVVLYYIGIFQQKKFGGGGRSRGLDRTVYAELPQTTPQFTASSSGSGIVMTRSDQSFSRASTDPSMQTKGKIILVDQGTGQFLATMPEA